MQDERQWRQQPGGRAALRAVRNRDQPSSCQSGASPSLGTGPPSCPPGPSADGGPPAAAGRPWHAASSSAAPWASTPASRASCAQHGPSAGGPSARQGRPAPFRGTSLPGAHATAPRWRHAAATADAPPGAAALQAASPPPGAAWMGHADAAAAAAPTPWLRRPADGTAAGARHGADGARGPCRVSGPPCASNTATTSHEPEPLADGLRWSACNQV